MYHCSRLGQVTIVCKDRNKLFFDTVCTLADMQYDGEPGLLTGSAELVPALP
jgi:hypothetical protein